MMKSIRVSCSAIRPCLPLRVSISSRLTSRPRCRTGDQAIIDGEIDLHAGNNPDEWNVYLMGASRTNEDRRKK